MIISYGTYCSSAPAVLANCFAGDRTMQGPEVEELLNPIFSSSVSGRGGGPSRLTVFAYGQTGSGKTYTMGALTEAVLGRLLDAATGVSATGRQARLGLSYYEIYMAKP